VFHTIVPHALCVIVFYVHELRSKIAVLSNKRHIFLPLAHVVKLAHFWQRNVHVCT